jgi:hypothetical protein
MKSKILFGVMLASSMAGSLFISTPAQADLVFPPNTTFYNVICQGAYRTVDTIEYAANLREAQSLVADCQRRGGSATMWQD